MWNMDLSFFDGLPEAYNDIVLTEKIDMQIGVLTVIECFHPYYISPPLPDSAGHADRSINSRAPLGLSEMDWRGIQCPGTTL
jgi:hypothetical protein